VASRNIRILCLGDLVGRPGRRVVRECLAEVRESRQIDFVLVNIENATNGAGVRAKEADELLGYGIDCMTSGDHILDYPEVFPYLESQPRLLRPENYEIPGRGAHVYEVAGVKIGVVNVIGQVFMKERVPTRNAFHAAAEAVDRLRGETPIVLVDVHGEATSEKVAMGWHLDGKASAVFGTHTHVQTADAQILPGGTGYLTDLGMTGPHLGVIGRDKESVLQRFTQEGKVYMRVANEWERMTGAIFSINAESGRCEGVELFQHAIAAGTDQ
jgi:2',3'-cyclic-nucleotide 2'-phosphodiesterase